MAELVAAEAPERLRPLYRFHVSQARSHLEVVSRFGRFPHRNPILGRASTAAEAAWPGAGRPRPSAPPARAQAVLEPR